MAQTTTNSKFIKATVEQVYHVFAHAKELEAWLAPGNMTGKVHQFDWREGGGYQMSLYYLVNEKETHGKTSAGEDRFTARLITLIPFEKIIQTVNFDSADPLFASEMIMEVSFDENDDGTNVTFLFKNIPPGIKPEDNEKGTELTLQKLANYIEQKKNKPYLDINYGKEIDEQFSDGSANAFEDK